MSCQVIFFLPAGKGGISGNTTEWLSDKPASPSDVQFLDGAFAFQYQAPDPDRTKYYCATVKVYDGPRLQSEFPEREDLMELLRNSADKCLVLIPGGLWEVPPEQYQVLSSPFRPKSATERRLLPM